MGRPFCMWRTQAPFNASDRSVIARPSATALTHIVIHGITLTEIPVKSAANQARLHAVPSEFAVRASQLPPVAADSAIQPAAHPNIAVHIAAIISHFAVHIGARGRTGRRLRGRAHRKQTA